MAVVYHKEGSVSGIDYPDDKKEKFEALAKEWNEIYNKFKKDAEALIEKAGGEKNLSIHTGKNIYQILIFLKG